MAPHESLDDLVARYLRDGDEQAADEVVRRTRGRLLGVARRIGSPQDAEDAVHTAYLSLLHKRGGEFDAPVLPWLVTAVVRIAYRHKAKEQKQAELSRRLAKAPSPTPASAAARGEEVARLRASVDRLPAKYRDVVVLHYLQGLSTREVADLLAITPDAVKKRLQRARALLVGALAPWIVLSLMAAPWCLADLARNTGALLWTGGVMQAKAAVALVAVSIAAGTAGFGAAVATGARSSAPRPRTDAAALRERADESLALLDQVARLEERARMLEQENRSLRMDGTADAPAFEGRGSATSEPQPKAPARKTDPEPLRRWRERLRAGVSIAVLVQGTEVLRATSDYRGVEKVYRDQLQELDERSPEGVCALMQLGHLHRGERDYEKSDAAYGRIRAIADPESAESADAVFQLAWNRRFANDLETAERLFREASELPGARDGTDVMALYNIAYIHESAGRREDARREYETTIREHERSASSIAQFYLDLCRKQLAALK